MRVDVGDAPLITWILRDQATGDLVDATVTCSLTSPAGVVSAPTPVRDSVGSYSVAPLFGEAGEWRGTWTASGAFTAVDPFVVLAVSALDGWTPPSWAPTLRDVAVHIPTRTRAIGTDDAYLGTFSSSTTPDAEAANTLTAHACVWATAPLGQPVMPAVYPVLHLVAALYAAWSVEVAYPERDADATVYDQLREQAEGLRAQADAANRAAGGGTSLDTGGEAASCAHSFLDPPTWADTTFL